MQEQLYRALSIASLALPAACATKPAPRLAQIDCASVHFPVQLSMAGALEGFGGQYSNGDRSLTLRQDGYSVRLAGPGAGARELRQTSQWRFQDGCGVTYQLSLPLNGTGALLEVITPEGYSTRLSRIRDDDEEAADQAALSEMNSRGSVGQTYKFRQQLARAKRPTRGVRAVRTRATVSS